MDDRLEHDHNRRELLVSVCRYAALALLSLGAAAVLAKRRRLVREGKCISSGVCAGCEILADCGLPRALSAKETLIGGENGRE